MMVILVFSVNKVYALLKIGIFGIKDGNCPSTENFSETL
jgi:hypothetical protein